VSRNSVQKCVNSHMHISAFRWPLRTEVGIWHSEVFPRRAFTSDVTHTHTHTHAHTHTHTHTLATLAAQGSVCCSFVTRRPGFGISRRNFSPNLSFVICTNVIITDPSCETFGTIRSEKLLTNWATTGFSRRNPLHGVSHFIICVPLY
jgi:hypothetical protein